VTTSVTTPTVRVSTVSPRALVCVVAHVWPSIVSLPEPRVGPTDASTAAGESLLSRNIAYCPSGVT
jgi:hypothetical protein